MAAAPSINPSGGHEPGAATSLAEAKRTNKFVDPSLYKTFSFTSPCPVSRKAALGHLRVFLKSVAKQNVVDPASAIFTESELLLSWKRPVLTKAAHAWFYRALLQVNWKGSDGLWTVEAKLGSDVPSTALEVANVTTAVATSLAPLSAPIPVATSLAAVFPTSPTLKLLRGGDKSLETESRYELGEELGSGTFGTVFAAKLGNLAVAIKRFNAETVQQAKIDAAEVVVSRRGGCRLNASQSIAFAGRLRQVIRRRCFLLMVSLSGVCGWYLVHLFRAGALWQTTEPGFWYSTSPRLIYLSIALSWVVCSAFLFPIGRLPCFPLTRLPDSRSDCGKQPFTSGRSRGSRDC